MIMESYANKNRAQSDCDKSCLEGQEIFTNLNEVVTYSMETSYSHDKSIA